MGRLIITENEKKEILSKYGLISETTISQLPNEIQSAINSLKTNYGLNITDSNIQKELEQEGNYTIDSGGEDPKARESINRLVADAKQTFPKLKNTTGIVSGYRSYSDQVRNFGNKATKRGVDNTQRANTIPGFSQHHTGKAFDIFSVDTSWWNTNSDVKKWVEENCSKYGFKVTYTETGKLRIPEPWHLFYVGGGGETKGNSKIDDKVDNYYKSSQVNPEFEKKTEKYFGKVGCKASNKYTDSPTFDEIKSGGKVMRIGHKGTPVEEIQKKLISLNYDLGRCGADGLFGPKTKAAIESIQTKSKLEVSSSVDKNTLEKLNNPDDTMKNSGTNNTQTNTKGGSGDVILMGGLDYRKGDLSITQQIESLKSTVAGKNVIGFRYNELSKVLNAIKENPNAYVVLFSAGCGYASTISNQMTDKTKLFIVEPYATSANTAKSVQTAVNNGTPSKNVIVGPNSNRGAGVVANATKTPSSLGHWDALKNTGNLIS